MAKRLVNYSFSSDKESEDESMLETGSERLTSILPTTPWNVEDEWCVVDEVGGDEVVASVPARDTEKQSQLHQGVMIAAGKATQVKFREGECRRAFRGTVYCKTFIPDDKEAKLDDALASIKDILLTDLKPLIGELHGVKVWIGMENKYYSSKNDRTFSHTYETPNQYITNDWSLAEKLDTMVNYLYARNGVIIREQSEVQYLHTESITVKAIQYNPIAGRSFRPLPPFLARKHKSILNIRNSNEKCFGYCLCAYFLREAGEETEPSKSKHNSRPVDYEGQLSRFQLDQITYPVNPISVPEIEDQLKLRINLLSF